MSEIRSTSDVDIRLLSPEESARLDIASYAFEASPAPPTQDREQYVPFLRGSRLPHAFDATGTPVARLAIYPQRMNVRGKILASGGVGSVASLPAGRRSGMVRALMRHSFELMREDGQAVSALYPFRPSFYQRLGYAGWIRPQWAVIDPAHLEPVLKAGVSGTTEWGRIADKWDEWCAFLARVQRETHGFTISDKPRGDLPQFRNDHWVVLVHEGDEVTGGMTYQITSYGGKMIVPAFYPLTVNARYTLLEWIARHADQTTEAHIQVLPGSWPELWLHDVEAPTTSRDDASWAAPMGRIVSVDGLTGIGAGEGRVALELMDDACPWNTGTWTFHGTGEVLEVAPGGEAQATLAIQALASLVFNGAGPGSEPESFRYRGWGNADNVADALRGIFPPARPFIHDRF
jgi:predicted acetyltransferase